MGFRSTFTTEDYPIKWPDWFFEKYKSGVNFRSDRTGTISSDSEYKTYGFLESLPSDIQKCIDFSQEFGEDFSFILVYLHECGGITRCQVEKSCIKWSEPFDWVVTQGVTHNYCYGCSDVGGADGSEA